MVRQFQVDPSKSQTLLENTHRENTPSNKLEALTKSMNMEIWIIVTLLSVKGSNTEIKIKKTTLKTKKFGHEKFRTKFDPKIITFEILCCLKILKRGKF